jgi:hypothetical protein
MIRPIFLSVILSTAAFAQVGGPVLGYVPEADTVRVLNGLPAAGSIGGTIAEGGWSKIAVSPAQNFLIATLSANGEVLNVNLIQPSVLSIPGVSPNPDLIAISPSGASAALWFTSLGRMQVVTGLPSTPVVATLAAPFLNSTPSALAVADDGQWAAGIWSAGVYAFGSTIMPLQTDPGAVALAFFHNSHDLALATAARATSIADVGGASQPSVLYDYSAQSLSPRAIALSFDNQHAVVADSTGKLVNIAVPTATASTVNCGCTPTCLFGLGDAVFRLNGTTRSGTTRTGPTPELKLFDAAAGSVWIVPPALSEVGGARQ